MSSEWASTRASNLRVKPQFSSMLLGAGYVAKAYVNVICSSAVRSTDAVHMDVLGNLIDIDGVS